MGQQCTGKEETLELQPQQQKVLIKAMTLNYGKATYCPFDVFMNGCQFNMFGLNVAFFKMFEEEFQDFDFQDREEMFGPLYADFRKGRYSPMYQKLAGIDVKKAKGGKQEYSIETKEQFFQNWEKRYVKFRGSKTMKAKYDKIDKKELDEYRENYRKFDFLIFKSLLKHIFNMSYEECLRKPIDIDKYIRALESDFTYQFLDEHKKASILIFQISKMYPHVFFLQNHSDRLLKKMMSQAKSCFQIYSNKDQIIIVNKQYFRGQKFKIIDLEQEAKQLKIQGYFQDLSISESSLYSDSNKPSKPSISNKMSNKQSRRSRDQISIKQSFSKKQSNRQSAAFKKKQSINEVPVNRQQSSVSSISSQLGFGANLVDLYTDALPAQQTIQAKKVQPVQQTIQARQIQQVNQVSEEETKGIKDRCLAITSDKYLFIGANLSSQYWENNQQVQFLERFLDGVNTEKTKRHRNKVIIVGGNMHTAAVSHPDNYQMHPDEEITRVRMPMPLCEELHYDSDSSDDQETSYDKLITNRDVQTRKITLIDGKTPATKEAIESDDEQLDQEYEDNKLKTKKGEKQFDTPEEEEQYQFTKKADENTFLPCEIHPFESYLVQVIIDQEKVVETFNSSLSSSLDI